MSRDDGSDLVLSLVSLSGVRAGPRGAAWLRAPSGVRAGETGLATVLVGGVLLGPVLLGAGVAAGSTVIRGPDVAGAGEPFSPGWTALLPSVAPAAAAPAAADLSAAPAGDPPGSTGKVRASAVTGCTPREGAGGRAEAGVLARCPSVGMMGGALEICSETQ